MKTPPPEQLLASAIRYLIDGQEYDAANLLLACSLSIERTDDRVGGTLATITVRGPRALYEMASAVEDNRYSYSEASKEMKERQKTMQSLENAIKAVMPYPITMIDVGYRTQLVDLHDDWHKELLEISRGKPVHNQAVQAEHAILWNNHRFRSQAEIRLANALEKARAFFLPNCKARLGISKRENREPDFLVCHKGKWGIIEVDGEPFHPPSRTVDDHERDRLFLAHGIKLVQHFDAAECFENAEGVVHKFLYLLEQS
jgi:hypothetical protein